MRITRLVLQDFGPYGGRVEFDLRTSEDRPIVLFGGQNGAGKTTLFESIRICLHGRSAFEERISRADYEDRIRSRLHESGGRKANEAEIRLEFEYASFGETDRYVVTRSFRDRGKSVVEDLTIKRNGSELSDLEKDQWDDFLKELIPPGISQLFFFDGEKIKRLADMIEEGDEFGDSLMSLLGLDLVDQLDTDLSIYLSNKLDEEGRDELAEKIEHYRERIARLEDEEAEVKAELSDAQNRIDELDEQVEKKEQMLAEEGGAFAEQRDEHKQERARVEERIEGLEEQIRELVRDCYPFALAPELSTAVVEQLESEVKASQQAAAQAQAVDVLSDMSEEEDLWAELDIDPSASDEVVSRLQTELRERLQPESTSGYSLAAEFSEREQQEMRSIVDTALTTVPERMEALTRELEQATKERQDLEEKIKRAPDESSIDSILTEINDLNEERAELRATVDQLEQELEEVESKLSRARDRLENRLSDREELSSLSDRAELASDVRAAVQEYRGELVEAKLARLETLLTERYLQLSNKSDFYEGVVVETDDLSIGVKTQDGDLKDQSQLSAGERQIFATAMLWALADLSDRPLPFIVDTPLGRLDQEHRGKLVRNFFPEAAHQVLLFSTDTEIVESYHDSLRDDISAEYLLDYDEDTGQTNVRPGYFWIAPEDARQEHVDTTVLADAPEEQQAHLGGFNDE